MTKHFSKNGAKFTLTIKEENASYAGFLLYYDGIVLPRHISLQIQTKKFSGRSTDDIIEQCGDFLDGLFPT